MKLLNKIFKKKVEFKGSKQVIEFAFSVGGIYYYQHTDVANMPYKRALKSVSVYNELLMKCNLNYLIAHTEATEKILNKGGSSLNILFEVKKLNAQLKERLTWIFDEDLVYKLASIRFFDKNENPEDYDWKYCQKKIKHWKRHEEAGAFFLREPIARLIPFLKELDVNVESYSQVQKMANEQHLENICTNLSENRKEELLKRSENLFWEETFKQRLA